MTRTAPRTDPVRWSMHTLFRSLPMALALVTAQAAAPAGLHPTLAVMPGEPTAYLLGSWQGGRWLSAPQTRARLQGTESYRRLAPGVTPTQLRAGGIATSLGAPCEDTFEVPVPSLPRGLAVLTPAALNAQPRPVTELPTRNATYERIVRDELIRRGVVAPQVTLTRLTRTDLDGNGTQEVIIEARRFRGASGDFPPPTGQPGDYSLLLLRHVTAGRAVTTVLGAHVAPRTPWNPESSDPMPMATQYRLVGVADLNGDGRMELVLHDAYYEGAGFTVQEWTPAGLRPTPLDSGCGA
ncbi:hypothetical protein M8445_08620 [Deinococcus aquaticus]|uniref:VCBS repeat-containing protein n=1 Tax=Deinococcus aquaticus TaxID=328692 RepID=A0ABY7UX17_9DEIO|nr:hypothetical protein [Deinococcus aquaticus]WDA57433.1 hypothetical protein M8445_08620 [Deinococcus aquaticus]